MEHNRLPLYEAQPRPHRSLQLALFVASITWVIVATVVAARAARGLAIRFQLNDGFLLLNAIFLLFLVIVGLVVLEGIANRNTPIRRTIGLPRRPTAATEWGTGAALGWGIVLVSVLTMALAGALHVRIWLEPRSLWLAFLNLITLGILALASEIAFRGYAYRCLINAMGTSWATVVISIVFAIITTLNQEGTYLSTFIAILFSTILCAAWHRTHGLWFGWGLHFAWIASIGILFGLPVNGFDTLSSVVQTRAIGLTWLTGGDLGPEGALLMPLLLLAALIVLYRVTRDWWWHYTHAPIIAGGYPMDVAPPPAHAAMENKPASAPALVQILPSTSQSRSVEPDTSSE